LRHQPSTTAVTRAASGLIRLTAATNATAIKAPWLIRFEN
jgi:hypothetical protein